MAPHIWILCFTVLILALVVINNATETRRMIKRQMKLPPRLE